MNTKRTRSSRKSKRQIDALARERNKQLGGVLSLAPGFSCQGVVGEFFDLYMQSEVLARKLQGYYRTDAKLSASEDFRVDVLKSAVEHFQLSFSESEIESLFRGGTGTRGKKSARQLRNGYVHTLSKEDRAEIYDNSNRYISSMRRFLSIQVHAT